MCTLPYSFSIIKWIQFTNKWSLYWNFGKTFILPLFSFQKLAAIAWPAVFTAGYSLRPKGLWQSSGRHLVRLKIPQFIFLVLLKFLEKCCLLGGEFWYRGDFHHRRVFYAGLLRVATTPHRHLSNRKRRHPRPPQSRKILLWLPIVSLNIQTTSRYIICSRCVICLRLGCILVIKKGPWMIICDPISMAVAWAISSLTWTRRLHF